MAPFYEFPKDSTSNLDTEYERVGFFVRGLRLIIHMSTKSLVVMGMSFAKILDHTQMMKKMHHEVQGETITSLDIKAVFVGSVVVPHLR